MSAYLHGSETVEIAAGSRSVSLVRSGVIGLVGTAESGDLNKPTLLLNDKDDNQFGETGSIPGALKILRRYGCAVVAVNVGASGDATAIVGDSTPAGRTGIEAFADTFNRYGFDPKVLIAPGFSTAATVTAALIAAGDKYEGMAYSDVPPGTSRDDALSGRAPAGPVDLTSASQRVKYHYPFVKNGDTLESLSTHAAGARAKLDRERGFWHSASNTELLGVTDIELPLTARVDDPNSDANALNAAGITTVFNSYGTGYRLWGNRSAAFPTDTHLLNFEVARRTADVINQSIRFFELQYIDKPLSQGVIDSLVESVNAFIRKLVGDGAVYDGTCWFDPARNSAEQLSAGHVLLQYKFTPVLPMERITNESIVTNEYLATLKGAA